MGVLCQNMVEILAKIRPYVNAEHVTTVIRVGVAGWDYPDWAGIVYPSPLPRGFDRLAFLAGFFDAIEINVTFYRRIDAKIARSWVARVPSDGSFRFTCKLHQAFTHAPEAEWSGSAHLEDEVAPYRAAVDPLVQAGRLGAVLMQFPQSFHDRPDSRRRLEVLADLLAGLPLVAEFRHRSWGGEGPLALLRERGVGFCNIDQPALGSTLPPTEHVTSRVGYVRLHGRNAGNWFAQEGARQGSAGRRDTGSGRYDYLYSMEELQPWVERVRRIAGRAEEVFVIANNHYRGKGPANALMLKGSLAARPVEAPAGLVAAYPDLAGRTLPVDPVGKRAPRQGRLF